MGNPSAAAREWQPPNVVTTLTNFLQQRYECSQVQKEKEKEKLTKEDYQRAREELNKKAFLAPLDADNTKASIYYNRQKWTRLGNRYYIHCN